MENWISFKPFFKFLVIVFWLTFPSFSPSIQNPEPIKILLLGDSITRGNVLGIESNQTFPHFIKEYFNKQHLAVEIINKGISGECADQAFSRLPKIISSSNPDIVTIMYGTNDAYIDEGKNEGRLGLEAYKRKMANMIRYLQDKKIKVVLMTSIPMASHRRAKEEPYLNQNPNFNLKPYVAACRQIAENHKISLVDNYRHWEEKSSLGQNLDEWLIDGIHPNEKGHMEIARTLFKNLLIEARNLPSSQEIVKDGKIVNAYCPSIPEMQKGSIALVEGVFNDLYAAYMPSTGDFEVIAEFSIIDLSSANPVFVFDDSELGFNGGENQIYLKGDLAGNSLIILSDNSVLNKTNKLELSRISNHVEIRLNDEVLFQTIYAGDFNSRMGFKPGNAAFRILNFEVSGNLNEVPQKRKTFTIPVIDISNDFSRQITVDREKNQYLGHPTTVLLEDNKTIYIVYPKGHGKGAIVMKKSEDAGLSWSERLETPVSWSTSLEVPTLYPLEDKNGVKRLIMFSGLYPIRMAVSEDNGNTWSELEAVFNFGGIVANSDLIQLKNGDYMSFFHDNGKFYKEYGKNTNQFVVYKMISSDGGLSWADPEVITYHKSAYLCESGMIRSPDGDQLAMLLRENSRVYNSMVIFSNDEGATWTDPVELPASLTGDRHQLMYTPDGRIIALFRDMAMFSETKGDFVAWVGTWDDIVNGNEGQYRIRLLDNTDPFDCGYPALELLPDETFITTTYGHWDAGEMPYIKSVRFKISETDSLFKITISSE
jgi:lysophospholipase L1-like esterase